MSHIVLCPSCPLVSGAATPDVLLEPGKILTCKDTQIAFGMMIGDNRLPRTRPFSTPSQ